MHHVRAYYLYALSRYPANGETLRVGVLPFTELTQDQNVFRPQSNYSTAIAP